MYINCRIEWSERAHVQFKNSKQCENYFSKQKTLKRMKILTGQYLYAFKDEKIFLKLILNL